MASNGVVLSVVLLVVWEVVVLGVVDGVVDLLVLDAGVLPQTPHEIKQLFNMYEGFFSH